MYFVVITRKFLPLKWPSKQAATLKCLFTDLHKEIQRFSDSVLITLGLFRGPGLQFVWVKRDSCVCMFVLVCVFVGVCGVYGRLCV